MGNQPGHVILLLKEPDGRWRAVSSVGEGWQSEPGELSHVVEAARHALGNVPGNQIGLKVASGTRLEGQETLALIEANRGPQGLDLSGCDMNHIDLSRDTIQLELKSCAAAPEPDPPPWVSEMTGGVRLEWVRLRGTVLSNARLQGADLYDAQLQEADLKWAQLQQAQPMWAGLEGADLWSAQLQGADLTGAQLQRARLGRVQLEGATLAQAQLQGVDLYYALSLLRIRWYGAFLDRTRMRRDQLGDAIGDELEAHGKKTPEGYREASEAYLVLKSNFDSIGRYDAAAWAYIKEQQMEKMAYYREWRSCGWHVDGQ
jgi:uncharacterized protein YjbI with pentapeptide repeats